MTKRANLAMDLPFKANAKCRQIGILSPDITAVLNYNNTQVFKLDPTATMFGSTLYMRTNDITADLTTVKVSTHFWRPHF